MKIALFIVIFLCLLVFKVWWDWRAKNIDHRIISHELSAAIDGLAYIIVGWSLFGFDAGGWVVLAVGLRWLLFDILFNYVNEDPWNHYGTSARLDRFLIRLGKWHLVPKIIIIATGVVLILVL